MRFVASAIGREHVERHPRAIMEELRHWLRNKVAVVEAALDRACVMLEQPIPFSLYSIRDGRRTSC